MSEETRPRPVRESLAEAIRATFSDEWLAEFAESVKGMTTDLWGDGVCESCGSRKRVKAQFPDLKGQINALTELLEQAEGRPGVAAGEVGGISIVVERHWPPRDGEIPAPKGGNDLPPAEGLHVEG